MIASPTSARCVECEREELVGLAVGHRAVGEEGQERRAGVGDRPGERLGLRDACFDGCVVAVDAPGAALDVG